MKKPEGQKNENYQTNKPNDSIWCDQSRAFRSDQSHGGDRAHRKEPDGWEDQRDPQSSAGTQFWRVS